MKLYAVYEDKDYIDTSNNKRIDVGSFCVDEIEASSLKEMVLKTANMCENFIHNSVFEDEKEAYEVAIQRTADKLIKIIRGEE